MPTYVITGPDGKKYRVSGQGSPEEALSAVQQQVGGVSPEPMPEQTAPQPEAPDPIRQRAELIANDVEKYRGKAGAGDLFINQFGFGLRDKVSGVVEGLGDLFTGGSFGDGYKAGSLAEQIIEERARERSGALGTAAEIGGAIGTGTYLKGAQAANSVLGRIGQTAKEAAQLGTIAGTGNSEATTVTGMAGDALLSGGLGAVLGAGFQGAAEVARPLIKGATAVSRSVRGLADNVDERAARRVTQALSDDGLSVGKAAGRMQRAGSSLINSADENTMGLGRAVSARPGPGRSTVNKALDAGQATRADRAMGAVKGGLAPNNNTAFNEQVMQMTAQRGAQANKAYQAAFKQNFGPQHSMAFDALQARVPAEAVKNAMRVAQAEGRPFGQQLVAAIDDATGNVTFRRTPSLEEWHYIQRGLRSATDSAYRSGAGEVGTAYRSLHKDILGAMDAANPTYKMARQAYATQSQLLEALQRGREIMRPAMLNNLDQLADDFARLSRPEQDMMRMGLARGLEDVISSTPDKAGNVVNKIFGTPQKREAIRQMFPSDTAFRQFEVQMRRLAKEANVFANVRTGSRTSFVDAEKQSASNVEEAAGAMIDVARGGFVNATMRGLSKLLTGRGNMDPEVAARVAKILISEDPNFVMQALSRQGGRNLSQAQFDKLMSRAFQAMRGGSAVTAGAIAGQATATAQ
jgi:hypothetical protein